mmetsp:Transcript_4022/g.7807  ORF Transcript_4022/g.7807 Transcript_4022/m.7807 type:complete len:111 (-) Transcript_4022:269-601(-)
MKGEMRLLHDSTASRKPSSRRLLRCLLISAIIILALVLPAFVFYKLHVELIESYGRAENLFEQHSHQLTILHTEVQTMSATKARLHRVVDAIDSLQQAHYRDPHSQGQLR